MRRLHHLAPAVVAVAALVLVAPLSAEARPPVAPPSGTGLVLWHDVPLAGARPSTIMVASSGLVWFVDEASAEIASYDPASGAIGVYPATSGAIVASIAEAADGGVWYSDPVDAEMHRLDPVSGVVDDLPVPFPVRPLSVAPASDGSIWFGTSEPGAVGTVSPTGTLSLVPVSGSGGAPEDIAWGADGRLWMTQYGVPAVDALDPGSGVVTSYPVSASTAQEIEAGADGALWLADGASITRLDLAGHEQVLPVPAATTGPAFPYSLRAGGAGLVYADTEGRILTVASDGTFTPLGPGGSGHYVMSLALAPDGALWYSDARSGSLGWG